MVRPWRRATLVVSAVAAVEFVLLLAVAGVVLARPLQRALVGTQAAAPSHSLGRHAVRVPTAAPHRRAGLVPLVVAPRSHLRVLVLNGNGRSGAAASAAGVLLRLGYRIAGTANAVRQDYATTLVMYRPGYRSDALRLAHDLGARAVDPLDGMRGAALRGGELTVILGA